MLLTKRFTRKMWGVCSLVMFLICNGQGNGEIMSSLGHAFDKAALEQLQSFIVEDEVRTGGQRRLYQEEGKDTLAFRDMIPIQKLNASYPSDFVKFTIESRSGNKIHLLAVANDTRENLDLNSTVGIYRYNDNNMKFDLIHEISDLGPFKLEFVTVFLKDGKVKNMLVVVCKSKTSQAKDVHTRVVIYEFVLQGSYIAIREFQIFTSVGVDALTSFNRNNISYLVMGMRLNPSMIRRFPAKVVVLSYNTDENVFEHHSTIPAYFISDIEVFTVKETILMSVAYYRDQNGKLNMDSPIYQFNANEDAFKLFQTIPTAGALDIEPFVFLKEHFLVVANEASGEESKKRYDVASSVFKFVKGKFTLFDNFRTQGALKWKSATLPHCQNAILLAYADQSDTVDQVGFFVYREGIRDHEKVELSLYKSKNPEFRPKPNSLALFTIAEHLLLATGSENNLKHTVYEVEYKLYPGGNNLHFSPAELSEDLSMFMQNLTLIEESIRQLEQIVQDVVKTDLVQNITGIKIFNGNLISDKIHVNELHMSNGSILFSKNKTTHRADPAKYDFENIDVLESTNFIIKENISELSQSISVAPMINKNINLESTNYFSFIKLEANTTSFRNIMITECKINDMNFCQFTKDIVTNEGNDNISGLKIFAEDTTISKSIELNNTLNGMNVPQDLIDVNSDQVVQCTKYFNKLAFLSSVNISGKVNGISLSTEALGLHNSETVIGIKTFETDLKSNVATVDGNLDEVDVQKLSENTMITNAEQNVTGKKTFKEIENVSKDVNVKGLTNNYDLDKWSAKLLNITSALCSLNVEFLDQFHIQGNLTIKGALNGLEYPNDVVWVAERQKVGGSKEFNVSLLIKENLHSDGLVDNVDLEDVVTLTRDENISGKKTFNENLKTSANIKVASNRTVDSVDISELQKDVMSVRRSQDVAALTNFTSPVHALDCLTVLQQIDDKGVKFYDDLFKRSLLHQGNQNIEGDNKISSNMVVHENVTVDGKINGYSFPDSFLNDFSDQQINSSFEFNSIFLQSDALVEGLVNQINLDDFRKNLITTNEIQRVLGMKIFHDDLQVIKNMNFCCIVNNFTFFNLLTKHADQIITASKSFEEMRTLQGLKTFANDVKVETTVDGVDLSNFSRKILLIKPDLQNLMRLKFENATVSNGLNASVINGMKFKNSAEDIVLLHTNQAIPSSKEFTSLSSRSSLATNLTVDGIDVSSLSSSIVRTKEDARIEDEKKFENIKTGRLGVEGLIHSSNLSQIMQDTVFKSKNAVLLGSKTISGSNVVDGSITVNRLNGLDLSKDLVMKQVEQNISGMKMFVNDVTVTKDIIIEGATNNLEIKAIEEEAVSKTKDQVIKGMKVMAGGAISDDDVTIGAKIAGIDLSELDQTSVKLDSDAVIDGYRTFANSSKLDANLQVNGLVNEKNITLINDDAVMIDGTQVITGDITFKQALLFEKDLSIDGDINSTGVINQINVENLERNVMKKDSKQVISGAKIFVESCSIENTVNAATLNGFHTDEFVTVEGTQEIEGKKTFSRIQAAGNVLVSQLADGEKLPELASDTLYKTKNSRSVIGEKKFMKNFNLKGNLETKGDIDSNSLDPSTILTLGSRQRISSTTSFMSSVSAKKNLSLTGDLSGVDVTAMNERRVSLHGNQMINTSLSVKTFMCFGGINLNGTVNGIDLSEWKASLQEFFQDSVTRQLILKNDIQDRCPALRHTKEKIVKGAPYYIDYFEQLQSFSYSIHYIEPFTIGSDYFIAIVRALETPDSCFASQIMMFNSSLQQFVHRQNLESAVDSKFNSFKINGTAYLFLERGSKGCPGQNKKSILYRWNTTSSSFRIFQKFDISSVTDTSVIQQENGTTWLVIAQAEKESYKSNVTFWRRMAKDSEFSFYQTLPASMPSSMEAFKIDGVYFLAIAMSFDTVLLSANTLSHIYRLTSDSKWQFVQRIPTTRASKVKSFKDTEHHYIAFSKEQDKKILPKYSKEVEVFRYLPSKGQFVLDPSFGSLTSFAMGIETLSLEHTNYLIVAMEKSGINVFRFQLHFGYELATFIPQPSVTHVSSFMMHDQPILAVGSKRDADRGSILGESGPRLLKARLSGIKPSSVDGC